MPSHLPDTPHVDLGHYLQLMVAHGASDLFLSRGSAAAMKIQGEVRRLREMPLEAAHTQRLAYSVMSEAQIRTFEAMMECDLLIAPPGLGRFRVNVYRQRGDVALVVRYINTTIASLDELKLPPALKDLMQLERGLVLVVGAADSGKAATLAALVDHRNHHSTGHILTVEDPMEFEHAHGNCIVDQREVGLDTRSFSDALRHAMREAPDMIMIGEIRDHDTMQHAMAYAQSGRLCLSALHAGNAAQAIERMLNFFPDSAHRQVLTDLSRNLMGVVTQRLVPGAQGTAVPAVEVMLLSPGVSELIQQGRLDGLQQAIADSTALGMCTFDQSLFALYEAGELTAEQAVEGADSRPDLSRRIRLHPGDPQPSVTRLRPYLAGLRPGTAAARAPAPGLRMA